MQYGFSLMLLLPHLKLSQSLWLMVSCIMVQTKKVKHARLSHSDIHNPYHCHEGADGWTNPWYGCSTEIY